MIIKLKEELISDIINQIEVNNIMEFEGCFCGGADFYIGEINNLNTYITVSSSCRKSSSCDNDFYSVCISMAQECNDTNLTKEYLEWFEDDENIKDYKNEYSNLHIHNYGDVVLESNSDILLHADTELALRQYFYNRYKELYQFDPMEYDKGFKI